MHKTSNKSPSVEQSCIKNVKIVSNPGGMRHIEIKMEESTSYKTYIDSKYDNHITLSYDTIFNHEMHYLNFFKQKLKVKIAKAKARLELMTINRLVADTLTFSELHCWT